MAGRIPDHFIDDLLARTDIVDLIEAHLPLKKAGKDFQALCPFHGEKTPSFTISREKQFYHCFGCGAHGTAIGFLMNYRNLEFREAIEDLAQRAGMEIPREAMSERPRATRDLYPLLEQARAFYERALRQADGRERAVEYLKGRGITGEVAKRFRVGFAPEGWQHLLDALGADGATGEQLERAGLAIKRDRGGFYDRFRDRIMFPIHDRRGRVIGFGGRILDQGEPKYLNSPETDVFHKGRELYGLFEAAQAGRLDNLLVVEGYMDVIALSQFGMQNAVATLGTAVTADHLDQLFRQVAVVTFCFDGDAAGRRAAWKALEIALPKLEGDREVRFCFLPDGHDPDTAVREFGADGFFAAAKTFGLSDYLIDELATDVDLSTSEGKTRLVAKARPLLNRIPDEAHRAIGARRLATETRFDEDLIRRELGFRGVRRQAAAPTELGRYTSRPLQQQALALLLQAPQLVSRLDDDTTAFLRDELEGCETLLAVRQQILDGATTTAALLERYRGDIAEDAINELATLALNIPDDALDTVADDTFGRLRERAAEQRFQRIRSIPLAELSDAQKEILRTYRRGG